jgi:hypothetical protein
MLGLRPDDGPVNANTEMEQNEQDWECEDLRAEERLHQITTSFDEESEIMGDIRGKRLYYFVIALFNVNVF